MDKIAIDFNEVEVPLVGLGIALLIQRVKQDFKKDCTWVGDTVFIDAEAHIEALFFLQNIEDILASFLNAGIKNRDTRDSFDALIKEVKEGLRLLESATPMRTSATKNEAN